MIYFKFKMIEKGLLSFGMISKFSQENSKKRADEETFTKLNAFLQKEDKSNNILNQSIKMKGAGKIVQFLPSNQIIFGQNISDKSIQIKNLDLPKSDIDEPVFYLFT